MMSALGCYPPPPIAEKAETAGLLKHDIAFRTMVIATGVIILVGLVLICLGIAGKVHSIAGVVVICESIIPASVACSISHKQGYEAIYEDSPES